MNKIINTIIGDLNEKKEYRDNEKRAKTLPAEYAEAYKQIRNYIWRKWRLRFWSRYYMVY